MASCGAAQRDLYAERLGNFFADDLFAFESWILIPREPMQNKLLSTLARNQGMGFYQTACNLVAVTFCDQVPERQSMRTGAVGQRLEQ